MFGKRVRFSRSRSPPPPPPSPVGESVFEDDDEPWSEDDEIGFGDVSEAAATHGSASSSWSSSEEEEEEERWSDDSDSGDDGAGGDGNDVSVGRSGGSRSSGGRDGSSPAVAVRGGGGGGGEHPQKRRMGRHRQRAKGDQGDDDGEWSAGFQTSTSEAGGGVDDHPPGGAALADKIEWEAGFEEDPRRRQDGPSDRGSDSNKGERARWSGASVPQGTTGCNGDECAAAGAGSRAVSAEKVTVEREAGVVEQLQCGAGDAEWSVGFGPVADDTADGSGAAGGGAAALADKAEWDAGFDESDLGSGLATGRGRGGGGLESRGREKL